MKASELQGLGVALALCLCAHIGQAQHSRDAVDTPPSGIQAALDPRAGRRIEERLRATYRNIAELRNVDVRVSAGVVELRGEVLSHQARRQAESLAAQFGLRGFLWWPWRSGWSVSSV